MNPIATLRVLWAFLLSSVGLFAVVIVLLPPAEASPEPTILMALAITAVTTAAFSFVGPRLVHAQAVKLRASAVHEAPDPEAAAGFAGARRVRIFSDPAQARRLAFMTYQQYMIVGCALSEAVALFGVVLNRLGHPLTTALPFVVAGLVLVALRFPSEAKALELLQRAANARLS